MDQWDEEAWYNWAINQQKLALEHNDLIPEFWEEWSEEDQFWWAEFFKPEDWAGQPDWRRFDWDDLDDNCDEWSEEDWFGWANSQQEFWNANDYIAPVGFQYWSEDEQEEWFEWFNPDDWEGLDWYWFDWDNLDEKENDDWTYDDYANWALEQQAILDSEGSQEVPNDFNQWDEESQQYFRENFNA